MATEVLTGYTEVDATSSLTVAASSVTASTVDRNETDYVYKDAGASHFGDFTHYLKINTSSCAALGVVVWWGIATSVNHAQAWTDAIFISSYGESSKAGLYLQAVTGGKCSAGYLCTLSTDYYLKIVRAGSNVTCYVYSDSGMTNLLSTQTITGVTTTAYRYIYAFASYNDASSARAVSTVVSNLDLNEVTQSVVPILMTQFRRRWAG